MSVYQQGTAVNIVETFWTVDPLTEVTTPTDPASVVFQIEAPDGTITAYTFGVDGNVSNPNVGVYVCLVGPFAEPGTYLYEVTGSGGGVDVTNPYSFEILPGGILSPETELPVFGPCQPWTNGEAIVACGPDLGIGSDVWKLEDAAADASAILYELSGRLYPGLCTRTVRPCLGRCSCWTLGAGAWVAAWGDWFYGGLDRWEGHHGCPPTSTVKLAGSVRQIEVVKIGGTPLAYLDVDGNPNWRVDNRRDLVRLDSPVSGPRWWPGCQNRSLNDDQPGTFSVKYTWGIDVPTLGKMAAAELARELWKACAPGGEGECVLPDNVTQVVRAGLTYDRVKQTAEILRAGSTGLQILDSFIATVNPKKASRRPAVWSPDVRYAR